VPPASPAPVSGGRFSPWRIDAPPAAGCSLGVKSALPAVRLGVRVRDFALRVDDAVQEP